MNILNFKIITDKTGASIIMSIKGNSIWAGSVLLPCTFRKELLSNILKSWSQTVAKDLWEKIMQLENNVHTIS